MGIEVIVYREESIDAVKSFNSRLKEAGAVFQLSESPDPPRAAAQETYRQYFLAMDGNVVRGGYGLKLQPFWVNGQVRPIANLEFPLSEGIINKAFRTLGSYLLADATRRQPLQFALGGGMEGGLARILQAMGWKAMAVPAYFHVVHPSRFLRRINYLRTSPLRKGVLDALAVSGLGWAAITLKQARRGGRAAGRRPDIEIMKEFHSGIDGLAQACNGEYAMAAVRDSANLNILYPSASDRFIRLGIRREGRVIGWAVVLATQMSGHRHFGDMKVGTIVDCLAMSQDADLVTRAATAHLEGSGVDLIVTNQAAATWGQSLRRAGFLDAPSHFIFAASKELTRLLEPLDANFSTMHLNRGDGEGPLNL